MSVQVAVRVRPFNPRQVELKSKLCVEMDGKTTQLTNFDDPKGNREFTFDHSFWSHDGFYTNQEGLTVGVDILDNAWEGYHCCLFAYGQTGAGQSYSMVGYKPNQGIVPQACEEIFNRIEKNTDPNIEYIVTLTMLEIYNQKVQDLLIPVSRRPTGGLKIREHQTMGFFVQNVLQVPVVKYEDIQQQMEQGNKNRTIAATQMNAESSRAHTIIRIQFRRRENRKQGKFQKYSIINLVDLAGSEKVSKTGSSGDRLQQGMVIEKLAELESGQQTVQVPYRDSCLTQILSNALGGNSKTLMICAISPSNDNFEETLSTLRYADQAKKIKNKAIVNESAMEKIIKQLIAEKEKLLQIISTFQQMGFDINDPQSMSQVNQINDMEDALKSNLDLIKDYEQSQKERIQSWQKIETEETQENQDIQDEERVDLTKPHLTNINQDPLLDGKISYSLTTEETLIGRRNGDPKPHIVLASVGIKPNHASIINQEGKIKIKPFDMECAENIFVNGFQLKEPEKQLFNFDRIIFGSNAIFVIRVPDGEPRDNHIPPILDYEFAQQERSKNEENLFKESEKQMQKIEQEEQEKMILLEEQLQQQKEEVEIEKQKLEEDFQKKIQDYEKRMKIEGEKQRAMAEKIQTQQNHKLKLESLSTEKMQKQLEMERARKIFMDEENQRRRKRDQIKNVQEKLNKIWPQIIQANLIAKELKRNVVLKTKILYQFTDSTEVHRMAETQQGSSRFQIEVDNKELGIIYYWDESKFENRLAIIEDLLQQYFQTNQFPNLEINQDPFFDPPEPELIGLGYIKMAPLGYYLDNPVELELIGEGQTNIQAGKLQVNLVPTDESGKVEITQQNQNEMYDIEDPSQLLGRLLNFKVKIDTLEILDPQKIYTEIFCQYTLLTGETQKTIFQTQTSKSQGQKIKFEYERNHSFQQVTEKILHYINNGTISIQALGHLQKMGEIIQQFDRRIVEKRNFQSMVISPSSNSTAFSDELEKENSKQRSSGGRILYSVSEFEPNMMTSANSSPLVIDFNYIDQQQN